MTALHKAALGGHEAVVQLLFKDYRANVEAKDKWGGTALWRAAEIGHKDRWR
jgi:ankyrin repeat protein